MTVERAREVLGLDSSVSIEEIIKIIPIRKLELLEKINSAPSDPLKRKFENALKELDSISFQIDMLSSASSRRTLSHTKLADLPQSSTRFENGQYASIHLDAGVLLAKRYRIDTEIGRGGMGAVFSAFDTVTNKNVALKVMLPELMLNERARERFLNEAQISRQLSHPNIVNVYDVQQDADIYFLVMELLHGQDLRTYMENRRLTRQEFTAKEITEIADQLCSVLTYAHTYTVHRDIKPENIWVTEEGQFKLMDFGIAQAKSTSQRTKTGAALGTAYYMAPEQLKGLKDIDSRADIYALGVLLYELAANEVPAGLIKPLKILRKDLPTAMCNAIMSCLHASPEDRPKDALVLKNNLQNQTSEINLSTKQTLFAALFVGLLVFIFTMVNSSGLERLKKMLPMSQEEIAINQAELANLEGQIKSTKEKFENGRRNLASDLRSAERNKSEDLAALQHWQQVAENTLFAGSLTTELEGEFASAVSYARSNSFEAARNSYKNVLEKYNSLLQLFTAAGRLYPAAVLANSEKQNWISIKNEYGLTDSELVIQAQSLEDLAKSQEQMGQLNEALESWPKAQQAWKDVVGSKEVVDMVAQVVQTREAETARLEEAERKKQKQKAQLEVYATWLGRCIVFKKYLGGQYITTSLEDYSIDQENKQLTLKAEIRWSGVYSGQSGYGVDGKIVVTFDALNKTSCDEITLGTDISFSPTWYSSELKSLPGLGL